MRSVISVMKCHKRFMTLKTHLGSRFLEKCHSVIRGHVQFNKEHVRETDETTQNQKIA
ncbi:hypothetical protein Hgul01_01396 [Herpetosiphon gulosus]|uniref:Uncharacterized protein n=1 Tax=Herpetosiphon gulosus TaxID=1973496 RepID=A0ABP9WYE1_9CHLR